MTTSIPALAQVDNFNNPVPEIEVDGSVLQQLDPSGGNTKSLTPIQLIPPPKIDRKASVMRGPSLTDTVELDPSGAKDVSIAQAAPEPAVAKVEKPIVPIISEKKPDPVITPIITTSAPPAIKPGTVSSKPVNIADDVRPAPIARKTEPHSALAPVVAKSEPAAKSVTPVITEKPAPALAVVAPVPKEPIALKPIPKPDSNLVTEVQMDVPGIVLPPASALQPEPKKTASLPEADTKDDDLTKPPKTMKETEGLKAAVSKPVSFPITSKSKTRGEIDPSPLVEAKTPRAPVVPQPATKAALSQSMSHPSGTKDDLAPVTTLASTQKQQHPEIIYRNVPTPKPRPNVIVASKDFVEKARRTYEDTYTVVKRDGDKMPSIQKQQVARENLPSSKVSSARISVADIAGDPLASKLVAMTPDDIASALNGITPSAGGTDNNSRDITDEGRTGQRIRIVRENGNWKPRKAETPVVVANAGNNTQSPTPAPEGRYNIAFKSGSTDLPATAFGELDSGVIAALKSDGSSRIQIVAYASAEDGKETTAKRTSLARALSMRSYLISKGIDATRMDVRAMGLQKDAKIAPDQVEMILVPANKS